MASPVRFYLEALEQVLSAVADIQVVGVHETLESALHVKDADLVLIDASIVPPEQLPSLAPEPASRWLVVGVDSPGEVVRWAEVGIIGCVPSHETLAALVSAIRRAAAGEAVCSRQMAATLFRRIAEMHREAKATDSRVSALTVRERSVLQCLAMGYSNKRISRDLGTSTSTVKNHVRSILRKLGVANRGEASAAWVALESAAASPLPHSLLSQFAATRQTSSKEKQHGGKGLGRSQRRA